MRQRHLKVQLSSPVRAREISPLASFAAPFSTGGEAFFRITPFGKGGRRAAAGGFAGILAAMSLSLLTGCAVNPVTGQRSVVLTSPAQERDLGREQAQEVQRDMGLVSDPERTVAYVQAVGQRLVEQVQQSDFTFEFHVVDMEEPNAFALPGGYIYVSRGLLALINSEDELANVLGHEIGHVLARHAGRRMSVSAPLAILSGIAAAATGMVSPALGGVVSGIGQVTGGLLLASYSRDQEREADRMAMELSARAGWNPEGMSHLLRTLERDEDARPEQQRQLSFFATHPRTAERVATTAAAASSYTRAAASPIASDRSAVLARLDGLLVGKDPAQGFFVKDRFVQPAMNFSLRFPAEWRRQNARAFVAAAPRDGSAVMLLSLAGAGTDPLPPARKAAADMGGDPERSVRATSVNGLPAARLGGVVRTDRGPVYLHLTWIAYRAQVYQVTGMCGAAGADAYRPTFETVAASFQPLSASERAGVMETRLRTQPARGGEDIARFVKRTGSTWSPAETAIANALESDAIFARGQAVKVSLAQPFTAPSAP